MCGKRSPQHGVTGALVCFAVSLEGSRIADEDEGLMQTHRTRVSRAQKTRARVMWFTIYAPDPQHHPLCRSAKFVRDEVS